MVTSSSRRSYKLVVFEFACPAIFCATSIRPPPFKYAVIPVARKVLQPIPAPSRPALRPSPNHPKHVLSMHRALRQRVRFSYGTAEKWASLLFPDTGRVQVREE